MVKMISSPEHTTFSLFVILLGTDIRLPPSPVNSWLSFG